MDKTTTPEYLFESSWEVCNKVGGIYTVLSTKAHTLKKSFKDKLIFIGPDVWGEKSAPDFIEDNNLFVGEKGVYFDFILREISEDKRQYGNTHIICQNIPKEKFEKMTEDEKKAQPILGQIKEYQAAQMQATAEVTPEDADLPF